MKNDSPIGTLGEVMPVELTKNDDDTCRIKESSVQTFLDNQQIDEKAKEDKQLIVDQKRVIKKPKRNVFITEKEPNGMVQKFSELTIWRKNILEKYKHRAPRKNAIELILLELQTHFKHKTDVDNKLIAKFMRNKYRKTVAFSGTESKVEKYVVQIMSKIIKGLAADKHVEPGTIDEPFVIISRGTSTTSQCYNFTDEFYKHSPASIACMVAERHSLFRHEKRAIKNNIKPQPLVPGLKELQQDESLETTPETIPPKTDIIDNNEQIDNEPEPIKSDPEPMVEAPQPTEQNSNYIVNSVVGQLNMVDLIEKIVDRGGAIRINSSTFEINMKKGG